MLQEIGGVTPWRPGPQIDRPPHIGEGLHALSKARASKGAAVSDDYETFWSTVPEKALHPLRVPIIEALWWIGEPLSAVALVDVFDGFLSMWEAEHHLRVLDALNVTELSPGAESTTSRKDLFDVPRRLKDRNSSKGGSSDVPAE